MNNEERREALDRARVQALHMANMAQARFEQNSTHSDEFIAIACMWAQVATALKKEEGEHDTQVSTGPPLH